MVDVGRVREIELAVEAALSNGRAPTLADLGGVDVLRPAASDLADSALLPEILRAIRDARSKAPASMSEREELDEIATVGVEGVTNDLTLPEVVDLVCQMRPLSAERDRRCFNRFVELARDRSHVGTTRP